MVEKTENLMNDELQKNKIATQNEKNDFIISIVSNVVGLAVGIWVFVDPVEAIPKLLVYGFIYILPAYIILSILTGLLCSIFGVKKKEKQKHYGLPKYWYCGI